MRVAARDVPNSLLPLGLARYRRRPEATVRARARARTRPRLKERSRQREAEHVCDGRTETKEGRFGLRGRFPQNGSRRETVPIPGRHPSRGPAGAQETLEIPQTANVGQRPHVALQIDDQIKVVRGYNVDVQVGLQFRESTSTIVLSTTVRGSAARISRKESVSSSTTSARPDSDSETLFVVDAG
jgi:hypothetical protein